MKPWSTPPVASVVVPAHDEEATIAATLAALDMGCDTDTGAGALEVVVVCNGCSDATADIARATGAEVVEMTTASKIEALREGDRRSRVFPRIYLDGDVQLSPGAARGLAAAVSMPGTLVAGVRPRMDLSASSPTVRRYYDFRQRLPVMQHGVIGAGVYALSAEGRARFGTWPDILGDDQFVFRLFTDSERATLDGYHSVVVAPPDVRTIFRRGIRIRRGNRELTDGGAGFHLPPPPTGLVTALAGSLRFPARWPGMVTWLTINVGIRLVARWRPRSGDWRAAQQPHRVDDPPYEATSP